MVIHPGMKKELMSAYKLLLPPEDSAGYAPMISAALNRMPLGEIRTVMFAIAYIC